MKNDHAYAVGFIQGWLTARLLIASSAAGFMAFSLLVQHLYYAFIAVPATSFPVERWVALTILTTTLMLANCMIVVACRRSGRTSHEAMVVSIVETNDRSQRPSPVVKA